MMPKLRFTLSLTIATLTSSLGCRNWITNVQTITTQRLAPAAIPVGAIRMVALRFSDDPAAAQLARALRHELVEEGHFSVLDPQALEQSLDWLPQTAQMLALADITLKGEVTAHSYQEDITESYERPIGRSPYALYSRVVRLHFDLALQVVKGCDGQVLGTSTLTFDSTSPADVVRRPESVGGDEAARRRLFVPIDPAPLYERAYAQLGRDAAGVIIPQQIPTKVELYHVKALKESEDALKSAAAGDWEDCVQIYQNAARTFDRREGASRSLRGKLHFNLGVALAQQGRFDAGATELTLANALTPCTSYAETRQRIIDYKADALAAEAQRQQMRVEPAAFAN